MNKENFKLSNHRLQILVGNLLRTGVIIAATVVLLGGIVYLYHHGFEPIDYKVFHRVPPELCYIPGIVGNALEFHGKGLIQLGLLILIATPVARVTLSIIGFALQRDIMYVIVTTIVFVILIYSLINS
ncbi:MAG TPA: DUF1634 domain-containing protein [Lentisphaeria bacterium]|nr:MAG: hypothetical protein A2X47_12385 [Lentisphaerae bacterium GWF2_38_69]HBM17206.1 DUF1634 domain-containing protein [Lentisphaeria bacterium]